MRWYGNTYELDVEARGGVTTAAFRGRKVVLNEEAAQAAAGRLFDLADQIAGRTLVLSLAGVVYLTSTMLGKLMALHKRLRAGGGKLVLCDLRPEVFEVFEVTHLHTVLDIRRADRPAGRGALATAGSL
jgi:anti-sigma B factor antagonist